MSPAERLAAVVVALGATTTIVAAISRRLQFPYVVSMALAGLLLAQAPGLPHIRLSADLILFAFLPALVFQASFDLNLDHLREMALGVALLATAGTLITALAVALLAQPLLSLPPAAALLLGATLAPTDPVAVGALVRHRTMPPRLASLIRAESLFNNPPRSPSSRSCSGQWGRIRRELSTWLGCSSGR
jgi:CPA1 family monovalent cation:H+ antiporter